MHLISTRMLLDSRAADNAVSLRHAVVKGADLLKASVILLESLTNGLSTQNLLRQIIALLLRLILLLKTCQTCSSDHATQAARAKDVHIRIASAPLASTKIAPTDRSAYGSAWALGSNIFVVSRLVIGCILILRLDAAVFVRQHRRRTGLCFLLVVLFVVVHLSRTEINGELRRGAGEVDKFPERCGTRKVHVLTRHLCRARRG